MSTWEPPGPVAAAFYETMAPIACLMGPVGSGKTTVGLQRGVLLSYLWPEVEPGLRRVKFAVIRRLMKDLEQTTMPSWHQWYPKTSGHWLGDPPTHTLTFPHPMGGLVELIVEFKALGDQRIEEALRGYEPTFGYVDEVDLSAPNTLTFLSQRAGRYPRGMMDRVPKLAWGTCNAPEEDSWVVADFIDQVKPQHQLFRQPSGLSPQAENLAVVGRGYYLDLAEKLPGYERKRFVENIPGLSKSGDAVYEEFNPDLHVAARRLEVLPGRRVIVGMDAGGTPAAGLMQRAANGQWRLFGELTTHDKSHGSITGPNRFGETLRDVLAERCPGAEVRGMADPSAAYGADFANGESSWIETVARVAGFPVVPAPGNNDPSIRQEAMRLPMSRMIDGRAPGLLICPEHCKQTIRALGRDYKHQITAGRRTGILKNWASHLVDAIQYGMLDGSALHEVMARQMLPGSGKPIFASTDFNPFG